MKRPKASLLLRTALTTWAITIVTLVVYAVTLFPNQRRDFIDNLASKANGVTVSIHDLAASALITEDYSSVVDHCTEMIRGDPAIEFIVLTRHDGFTLVHDRAGWRTEKFDTAWHPLNRIAAHGIGTFAPFPAESFRLSKPLDYNGIEWGWVHVGLSLDSYRASVNRLYQRTLMVGAAAVLFALAASYFYASLLLRPILHIQSVVGRVAAGELTAHVTTGRNDELGDLANSVNKMTEAILHRDRTLQEANTRLEERVDARTRELREQMAQRERAHSQLVDTQRRLFEASRLAGMAQVATGVLHNVGNVLNSVNVSANLLREQIQTNTPLGLLRQTADLLRAQGDDVNRFLAEDPRGRRVPHLILGIADNLQSARSLSLHELDQLSRNIDHIKQIVAVQQNYAKAGGVLQAFDPLEVFTDAVRITNASITRHQIQLTTEAPPERPAFHADRHLVLQIIVNLLQNAVQSVKVHPPGERFVTLRLSFHDQFLRYAVIDNGVGIEPENTQNIFQHGFTTRKDGHGFGLHSGALAARNLGGSLQVASDGPGRGATFTLELPLEPTSPEQLPRA